MTTSNPNPGSRSPAKRRRFWIMAVIGALVAVCAVDLYGPLRVDIRVFDPEEVARLDTEMWRSYYDRKPLPLYFQLADLLRRQFHFPFLRSHLVAASAARAAFVFKDGRQRADYERALPDLVHYFRAIRRISTTPFDVERTAALELEWWIVHRERARRAAGELERALAEGAAELYRAPLGSMQRYAEYRTVAMNIRDTRAAAGGVTPTDWATIERNLQESWRALAEAVRPIAVRSTADRPAGQ